MFTTSWEKDGSLNPVGSWREGRVSFSSFTQLILTRGVLGMVQVRVMVGGVEFRKRVTLGF